MTATEVPTTAGPATPLDAAGGASPPAPPEPPAEPKDRSARIEVIAAILLGIAAVLTAFAAYRAALLDGDALKGYTESTRLDAQGTAQDGWGDQIDASDQSLFTEWAILASEGTPEAQEQAAFILETLARPQLVDAIGWWAEQPDDPDGPISPFVEENPVFMADDYNPGWAQAQELYAEAEAKFEEGKKADDQGDIFEQAAVFLAGTLFFAGIAIVFKRPRLQYTMLIVAAVFLAVGGWTVVQATTA